MFPLENFLGRVIFSFLIVFLSAVSQVLPDDMIVLAEPDPSDMVLAITNAINLLPRIDPQAMHHRVSSLTL